MGYDALGPLKYSWHDNTDFQLQNRVAQETFVVDPMGNVQQGLATLQLLNGNDARVYEAGTGRLLEINPQPASAAPRLLVDQYDGAGNQVALERARMTVRADNNAVPLFLFTNILNVYDAQGRLRYVSQQPNLAATNGVHAPAAEEYADEETRYDALGRRVWVQSKHLSPDQIELADCGPWCSVTRFMWDGDQLIGEVRMPIEPEWAENDTQPFYTWKYGNNPDGGGPPITGGDSAKSYSWTWGGVSYVHGYGIDQPVAIVRQGGGPANDTLLVSPVTMYPHADWRGNITALSFRDGRPLQDGSVRVTPPASAQLEQNASLSAYSASTSGSYGVVNWNGSLLNSQFGETGLMYRRNRYYDPMQGRFTQEDPIGLAGGMNLYGFAGGDPVNFSDPFGLCPACAAAALLEFGVGAQVLPGVGTVLGGIAIATSAAVSGYALYKMYNERAGSDATSIPASGPRAKAGERRAVNDIGGVTGCHECGATEPGTKSGNWIPDHQPPTALNPPGGGPDTSTALYGVQCGSGRAG